MDLRTHSQSGIHLYVRDLLYMLFCIRYWAWHSVLHKLIWSTQLIHKAAIIFLQLKDEVIRLYLALAIWWGKNSFLFPFKKSHNCNSWWLDDLQKVILITVIQSGYKAHFCWFCEAKLFYSTSKYDDFLPKVSKIPAGGPSTI